MAIVDITIENRVASVSPSVILVCHNPTDIIRFTFDEEWAAHEMKTARFSWAGEYIDVVFTGDTVQVPEISGTHFVRVGVYAEKLTSSSVKVQCRRSILDYGDNETNPPRFTYYEKYEDTLDALIKSAEAASTAASEATEAAEDAADAAQAAERITSDFEDTLAAALAGKVDSAYAENGYLYLTANGEVVAGPLGPFAGSGSGGGGSSGNNAVLTFSNTSGWLAKTIAQGGECNVTATWSSIEDGIATGNGVLKISVNGATKSTQEVTQGEISINLKNYLAAGANAVKLTLTDVYGNTRSINYSVTLVALSLTSTFDASVPYSGAINFTYVPTGSADKTVHFILDGSEIGTATVTVSGRQQNYIIPAQSHGSHSLRVYFEAEIDGVTVPSNELYFDLNCIVDGNKTPNIMSAYRAGTVEQYSTIPLTYSVYDPANLTAAITLWANGVQVSSLTVDRTEQTWSYKPMDAGNLTLEIKCGSRVKTWTFTVTESSVKIEAETQNLELHLSSYGRSNNEENPATWSNNGIAAGFSGFNFTSDGWQLDENGDTVLRVSGDARLSIPLKIFEKDFRTTGKTIEIEFASRNVLDYDAVIMSCLNGGRGFEITAQRATLWSAQSEIGTLYKENEHVRLSFVIEKRNNGLQLLMIYLNGILSGIRLYPNDDDFSQTTPVGISIGSNECTIDLYNIRVYDNALTRYQVLDNWIADTQDGAERVDRFTRNAIYDEYGQVTIANLKNDLPYLVIECPVLPTFKGDKKTCSGYYVDPVNPAKSFRFENAEIDVQGTSSQYYWVKNWKIKFKGGFILTNGTTVEVYQLNDDVVPTSTYTMKADVASSEGANNVVLAQLYNDLCPIKTPPQVADPRVRQTIDGHPMVIFWDDGTNGPQFMGKYNFNHDKGTAEVFGFASGDESWEILQNGTERVGFHSADFSGDAWKSDFEARYPEDNTNTTNLAAFAAWVASTDTEQATGNALASAVSYDGVSYTKDTAEYRLAKFKAELPNHADVDALVFYYVFTDVFLCIDQREKNAFPTRFNAKKLWEMFFYDADSSLGTDNKGNEAFDYYLEDIDYTEAGDPIFNGQNSVLWVNLRLTHKAEIRAEYQRLRTTIRSDGSGLPLLSYEVANKAFEDHQSKWSEAIFNEDGYKKSIEPFYEGNDTLYIPMLRGKKELQRKYWMYNRFRYKDSQHVTGTSMSTRITIRAHSKANIYLTAYVNMYGHVYFNAAEVEQRMMRGQEYEFVWPASGAEDPVIGINDADMLTSLGDLSPLMVELIDLSPAKHLTYLKIGDASEDYENLVLNSLTFGNNTLMRHIDVRNCSKLTQAVDISGCTNVEEVYFDGTAITGLSLPNGGNLKTLHLPGTIANLTVRNQTKITDFVLPDYSNITTLRLENVSSAIPMADILAAIPANSRVRLIGFNWTFDTAADILALYDRLDTMRGLDENGNNMDKAQMSGTVHVENITGAELADMKTRYPNINVTYTNIVISVYFHNYDGEVLSVTQVSSGDDAAYSGETPERENTDSAIYEFIGWSQTQGGTVEEDALKNIEYDRHVYAVYNEIPIYYVRYYNHDGSILLYEDELVGSGNSSNYGGSTPTRTATAQYTYTFSGWSLTANGSASASALTNVTADRNVYAAFTSTVRTYTVRFYNGSTLLQTVNNVAYGSSATYSGSTPTYTGEDAEDYIFTEFVPSGQNITGNTDCYAQFKYDGYVYVKIIDRSISGEYENTSLTTLGDHALYYADAGLSSVSFPNVTTIGENALAWCDDLTTASLPKLTAIPYNGFAYCSKLTAAEFPLATSVGSYAFPTCSELETVDLTSAVTIDSYAFERCKKLTKVDLPAATSIGKNAFKDCSALEMLILRHDSVVTMGYENILVNTPIANGTGYIYVPAALVDSYKADERWSLYANQIRAIEDYPELWGKYSWLMVNYRVQQGDYASYYAIGDTIPLDLGSEGKVNMQIAAFDADDLADGSGKAHISFISKELLTTSKRWNPALSGTTEGTGTIGGWEKSELRAYYNDTLLPQIPSDVQALIKPVTKTQDAFDTTGSKFTQTTTETIWPPSYPEMFGSGSLYYALFKDTEANRIKFKVGASSATRWYGRSAADTLHPLGVSPDGYVYVPSSAQEALALALGFCV